MTNCNGAGQPSQTVDGAVRVIKQRPTADPFCASVCVLALPSPGQRPHLEKHPVARRGGHQGDRDGEEGIKAIETVRRASRRSRR
eukprot:365054-Chlamydomonas_euryale.AAC.1